MTHDLWSTLNSKMYDYLAAVSLAELVARQKQKLAGQGTSVMEDKRALAQPRSRAGREKAAAVI